MELRLGFFYVVVYGSSSGSILWALGYRLLWFWVFRWVFPRVLPMDVGWV